MPELPEVETVKRALGKKIVGKKISRVCIYHARVIRQPAPERFKKELEGTTVKRVLRKAKALVIELSNNKSLVIHLKMTGQLIYPGQGKTSRVSFCFSDGKILDFFDQRLFAELRLLDNWQSLPFIKGLGPEPFEITAEEFLQMLARKKTKIKPLIMDQTFIAGIGNLYAAESLFRAKIHPQRPANSLTDREKRRLLTQICDTLTEAIHYKGSSVDSYVQLSGAQGGYVPYHRVYDRQGKPCVSCKTPIKRITQGGRGTYFCPHCQQ